MNARCSVPHSPDGLQPGDELHDLVGGDEAVRRSVYQLVKSLGNLKAGKKENRTVNTISAAAEDN